MIRKAIAFLFTSRSFTEISSISLKNVLVDRQEKITNNIKGISNAAVKNAMLFMQQKYPVNIETTPEVPPEIKAVLALGPINTTEVIPQQIRNTPQVINRIFMIV